MFRKNNEITISRHNNHKKDHLSTVIAQDVNLLGNIVSEGNVDFDGTINGNMHCHSLTVRENGLVQGEITAENVHIYGKLKGLIRAKNVHLYASSNIEGVIMHETLSIEDGAFIDGKFKRTDKPHIRDESMDNNFSFEDAAPIGDAKILENIRLIRSTEKI